LDLYSFPRVLGDKYSQGTPQSHELLFDPLIGAFSPTITRINLTIMDAQKDEKYGGESPLAQCASADNDMVGVVNDNADQLHRRLNNRQVQLVAVGGAIGTALFISIGGALARGGPLSLLLAYTFYSICMGMVNNCVAEMTILYPVSGGFVRMAGKWVDDAFGFMAGWNFFLYEALIVPFEITALGLVISYWSDDVPMAAVCGGCVVAYVYV
jgi:amino acid transporter